jgi:D-glycero-D-manno-heptose 1,7-bisphosphate phosphatase
MTTSVPPLFPGILLDRDGTLIEPVKVPKTGELRSAFDPSEIQIMPGVIEGLRQLRDAGFVFALTTNQPGPAKGQASQRAVTRTNLALLSRLREHGIDFSAVEVCLHHPHGGPGGDASLIRDCDCRKPKPGLLERAIVAADLDRAQSFMVGDSLVDLVAGRAAGVRVGLVLTPGRAVYDPTRASVYEPDVSGVTFDAVARAILAAR